MASRPRTLVILGVLAGLGACASAQAPVTPPSPAPVVANGLTTLDCAQFDRPGEPIGIVGLTESVGPAAAPAPGNDSERLLFRQVYETLVRIGCDRTLQPGLATRWQFDGARRAWILTLRETARFSDGTPVTAGDVIASWSRGGTSLAPDVTRIVQSATALDDHRLAVALRDDARPADDLPSAPLGLANAALAVARTVAGSPWPLGTRDVRLESSSLTGGRGRMTIALLPAFDASGPGAPGVAGASGRTEPGLVQFLVMPGRDVRDLLDQGVDLLMTRDAPALAYANALATFDALTLPWSRSYVFLSRDSLGAASLTPALRQKLAEDAVTGEAQGSSYDWPSAWANCAIDAAPAAAPDARPRPAGRSGRLVHDQADPVARALAARIVALASARSTDGDPLPDALVPGARSRKLQAVALPGAVLPSALERGDDAGYLIPIDRSNGCAEIRILREQAPWMTRDGVVPLVDTRMRALVRKGRSKLTLDGDGVPALLIPARTP